MFYPLYLSFLVLPSCSVFISPPHFRSSFSVILIPLSLIILFISLISAFHHIIFSLFSSHYTFPFSLFHTFSLYSFFFAHVCSIKLFSAIFSHVLCSHFCPNISSPLRHHLSPSHPSSSQPHATSSPVTSVFVFPSTPLPHPSCHSLTFLSSRHLIKVRTLI